MTPIYRRALAHFGFQHQLKKTSEECMELGLNALHSIDGKCDLQKLAEEVADTEIMCGQMTEKIRQLAGRDLVSDYKLAKIERLIQRIEGDDKTQGLPADAGR